ncbi:MAG: alpha/beta fold hydrolase, partial [Acidobacteria bacterium]|nr:alpha/beta fold hydrolase [Acidobacteriota bacterium]
MTTFVLVHGGGFAANCWDRVVPLLNGVTVAVDLPGRGRREGPVADYTLTDFADAVVQDIESTDATDIVLVGHSLAGATLPHVAARVPDRLDQLVFVSCVVPADGERVVDTLPDEIASMVEAAVLTAKSNPGVGETLDETIASAIFCNDMNPADTRYTLDLMVPEAVGVTVEAVSHEGLAHPIPRTWVHLSEDAV